MQRKNLYTFLSLFLVLIIDSMGFGIIMPILPPLFLNVNVGMVPADLSSQMRDFYFGLTMAVFFVFTFFGTSYMGDLSDRLGRKKVIMLCLAGVATGYLISAFGILVKSLWLLIGGRALCGFAAGSQAIAQASIIDISTPENKTWNLGMITLASCIGFIIGPMVGGFFSGILEPGLVGFSIPFFLAAFLALVNAISLQFTFKETYKPLPQQKMQLLKALVSFKAAFTHKNLRYLSLVYTFLEISWGIYFQFIALFLAHAFHYTTYQIGLFMAFLGVIFSFTLTFVMRLFLKVMGHFAAVLVSLILIAVGLIFSILFSGEIVYWLSVIPISMGVAIGYTTLMSVFSSRMDKDSQGLMMGITSALASLAWVMSGLAIGVLTAGGKYFPFLISLVIIVLSGVFLLLDARKHSY